MRNRLRILGWPKRKRRYRSDPRHVGKRRERRRLPEKGAYVPGDRIANQPGAVAQRKLRGRVASLANTIESLPRQMSKARKHITLGMVDAFAALVRGRLLGDDPAIRKAYVALFVSEVAINQTEIRISGSTRILAQAVGKTEPVVMGMVPIFDRKWCRLQGLEPVTPALRRQRKLL